MMKQTKFITKIIGLGLCVIFLSNISCNDPKAKSNSTSEVSPLFFKLSLAQWSFHNLFQSGQKSPYEFAKISKELGFQGIEYVSQFYPNVSTDKSAFSEFVNRNKDLSNKNEVENVLVMIDDEVECDVTII